MADVIQDVGVFNVKDELVFVDETYLGGEEITIEHVELEVAFHNEALLLDKNGTQLNNIYNLYAVQCNSNNQNKHLFGFTLFVIFKNIKIFKIK